MIDSNFVLRLGYHAFEVFKLRKQGFSAKEIAEELGVSQRTVDSHLDNIMNKGGFRNSMHLAAFNGEIIVGRKPVMKRSDKCVIIENGLLQGQSDKEIRLSLEVGRHTYGMLKRLVLNKPGFQEKLDMMNAPKPMFKWLKYTY